MIRKFIGYFVIIAMVIIFDIAIPGLLMILLANSLYTDDQNIDILLITCITMTLLGIMIPLTYALSGRIADKFDLLD